MAAGTESTRIWASADQTYIQASCHKRYNVVAMVEETEKAMMPHASPTAEAATAVTAEAVAGWVVARAR